MSDIFISYSRKDSACAYRIARMLEGQGFKIWIDKTNIAPGDPFPTTIYEAIQNARAMIILWSKNSESSPYVQRELEAWQNQYMHRQMPIIPIWLDDTALHPKLQSINATPLRDCDTTSIVNIAKKLMGQNLRHREIKPIQVLQPIGEQGAIVLETMPHLVKLAVAKSVYCKGYIITEPHQSLQAIKNHPEKRVQVFLSFPERDISQIYNYFRENEPNVPFFMFHFLGDALNDNKQDSPAGDWLDIIETIYETLKPYFYNSGICLQLFNVIPASLNFALGMQFFKYWDFQLYHFTRDSRYQLVLDTRELSKK